MTELSNGVNTEKTGEEMEEKKIQLTSRLQKREEDRIADVLKRKEEKDATSAETESYEFFAKNFNRLRSEIEITLDGSASCEKGNLPDHFDSLLQSVQRLQKITTDSAMFIPAYDVQKAQATITDLQRKIQEKRDEMIPRKKFAFKSKKKVAAPTVATVDSAKTEIPRKEIKVAPTDCNFADVSSKSLVKHAEETNEKDIALARLADCTVKIHGYPRAIHIDNLQNCKVFTGPVVGSIFMDNCKDCTFVLACQQLRIHNTTGSHFYIHVTSKAIIEDCKNVEFAPYNWQYEGIEEHYEHSGLDKSRNSWNDVDDFNWLASDAHSPNWGTIEESKRETSWDV